jgi:O-antigen/teichoic acid export membrane protein
MPNNTSLKRNTVANFAGRALIGLMGFLFVPVYLKYLGAESYGLIGFWATLAGVFAILDLGICATLNREMARLSADADTATSKMVDLLYTLERINWGIAVLVGGAVMLLSGPIATYWVNAKELPIQVIQEAVFLIGLVLLLQWPYSLYSSGLNGIQHQVAQNVIAVSMTALRNIGVIAILVWVSPTIAAFFLWQIGVYIVQLAVSRQVLWNAVTQRSIKTQARFRLDALKPIWRFAVGMSGISLVTMLLTQADRLVLSKMVTLDQFGYYSLAAAASGALGMLVGPVFTAVYPRLSQLVVQNDQQQIAEFYHRCCQIVAVSVLPVAIVMSLFSEELLYLWTRNAETTAQVHMLVRILVIGTALNGLMNIPYALQLAYGRTSLVFWFNVISVVVLVPTMVVLVRQWGPIGAAITWVLLNSGCFLIGIQLMHRRLLPGQQWRWYGEDVIVPAAAAAVVCVAGRLLVPTNLSALMMIFAIFLILILAATASAFSVPAIRREILTHLIYFRRLMLHD